MHRPLTALVSTVIIVFVASILVVSGLLFFVDVAISRYHILIAAVPALIVCWWGSSHYFPPQTRRQMGFVTFLSVVGIIFALTLISGVIYDTSWDGQNYHTEAILKLSEGWNPFYQVIPTNVVFSQLLSFYAKASWINAAALYQLTGNFEQGKVFNLLLMLASGLVSYATFSSFRSLKRREVTVLSLLAAFNPISLTQMFTFYVDGQLASCLIILVGLLVLLYRQQDQLILLMLFGVILITVNIKITGLVYVAVLGGGYGVFNSVLKRRISWALVLILVSGFGIGAVLIGFNPYITQYMVQYLKTGNPFYPTDQKSISLIDYNSPSNFIGMSWAEKMTASLFSKSHADESPSELKVPFSLSFDEIIAFGNADVRVAGFGPLFSGALVLAGGVLVGISLRHPRRAVLVSALLFIILLLFLSSVANPEAWWARYVPQLWLIPILIALIALLMFPSGRLRFLNQYLIVILFFNQMLIFVPAVVNAVGQTMLLNQQLEQLHDAAVSSGPINVNFNYFIATEMRFKVSDIDYTVTGDLPCPPSQQERIVGSETRICLP